jgi:TonB family protein
MYTPDARHMRGIGLSVTLNDQYVRLLLDTGGSGIMVSHKIAEKAGPTRITARHFGGLGDHGLQSGYSAVADHIRVGDLQFQDCVVSVIDNDSVVDQDGFIGANVFGAYLVDLDLPEMRLKLSPLPKRPEDTVTPKSLNSEGEEQAATEQKQPSTPESPSKESKSSSPTATLEQHMPRDRYIAPEMTYWTKVFRVGHLILLPTSVNFSEPMLFGLDTGSPVNIVSLRAQRNVSQSSAEIQAPMRGLSGEVNKAYLTKATLSFGHSQQWSMGIVAFDLSNLSHRAGTEVSGLLGFGMLRLLEVKIDYRDGLADFVYDPTRVHLLAQTSPLAPEQRPESPVNSADQKEQLAQDVSKNPLPSQKYHYGVANTGCDLSLDNQGIAFGALSVLNDTMGVDFGPYLQRVLSDVKTNWYNLIPGSARAPLQKKGKVVIEFCILRDGRIAGMRLQPGGTSGDSELDDAAWQGIKGADPFLPLPGQFTGQFLALRFNFYYNPARSDLENPSMKVK